MQIRDLDLSKTAVEDLSPLADMTTLRSLSIQTRKCATHSAAKIDWSGTVLGRQLLVNFGDFRASESAQTQVSRSLLY
jgi:hypothetical protein